MKQKLFYVIFLAVCFSLSVHAEKVSKEKAQHVAKNVLCEKAGLKQSAIKFMDELTISDGKQNNLYYVFNLLDAKGFVVISADDKAYPLIAYSTESSFEMNNASPEFTSWMENYEAQLTYIIENQLDCSYAIEEAWSKYEGTEIIAKKNTKASVEPLLGENTWDQNEGWNDLCPEDPAGPGGHVYAGCVATAASMIMKYYNYPYRGTGSETYYASGYGSLTANFGETVYDWAQMKLNAPTYHAALIQYHMGVAVHMNYGPDGSGASTSDAVVALKDHFGYSSSANFLSKNSYTNSQWETMVKANLDAGMPMNYRGQGSGGHSFCLDGYDDDEPTGLFHFNWGWSGQNNGYYNLTNLNPGTHNFTTLQQGGFNIKPDEIFEGPTNIAAEVDFNDITLTWDAPASDKSISGYFVYRNYEKVSDLIPASETSFTEYNLQSKYHTYNVIAYYESPEGISKDNFVTALVSANYDLTVQVLDEDDNPVSDASVSLYNTAFPLVKTTDANGKATYSISDCGKFAIKVSKNGYMEFADSVEVYEPEENFDVELALGIGSVARLGEKLYPNPAKSSININMGNEQVDRIEIIDLTGKVLIDEQEIGSSKNISYDLNGFASGMYYIKVEAANKTYFDKFIVE